jgi:deoxyribonuclease-4
VIFILYIGNHLSSSKGFLQMGKEALSLNANTFSFFTRNPRGSKAKDIDDNDVQQFLALAKQYKFHKLVAHAPYTLNPCSNREEVREFARQTIADDLLRMEKLPHNYYNFHPGNHLGQGIDFAIKAISDCLNEVMWPEQQTTVLLETMAGKGTEVGKTFAELQAIIERINLQDKIGVCLDTCHIWDGGYDIVNNLNDVLADFDKIIGLDKLKAIHLNDSKNDLNTHKDRHEKIGQGKIGLDTIIKIINHPQLKHLPFILETPNDHDGYAQEIALLRANFN